MKPARKTLLDTAPELTPEEAARWRREDSERWVKHVHGTMDSTQQAQMAALLKLKRGGQLKWTPDTLGKLLAQYTTLRKDCSAGTAVAVLARAYNLDEGRIKNLLTVARKANA